MCHDFHSRGGNPFTSIAVGLGHAMSNLGSDTLNVIPAARYYYDEPENEVSIYSVNASEHSVTCTGIFYYERILKQMREEADYETKLKAGILNNYITEYYSFDIPCEGSVENPDYLAIAEWLNLRGWLKKFPKGILSVVSDTFDLWKLITYILPRLKDLIMSRDGKLVIRPDSGNPVDILCGIESHKITRDAKGNMYPYNGGFPDYNQKVISISEQKGVVELLFDIFGGTTSKEGYIKLDSHIGAIYGDSINLERQIAIYERLAAKNYAATNVVLGIGSYTYVYQTRDSAGYAAKGAWFERLENFYATPESVEPGEVTLTYNIYKDPATDDGSKKSLKGFQFVFVKDGQICLESEVSEEKAFSEANLLRTIYKNGEFLNQTTLKEIREKLVKELA
jgi:nicotinamide phosphoribosyltransferase